MARGLAAHTRLDSLWLRALVSRSLSPPVPPLIYLLPSMAGCYLLSSMADPFKFLPMAIGRRQKKPAPKAS